MSKKGFSNNPFKDLKKALGKNAPESSLKKATPKPAEPVPEAESKKSDEELFLEAMNAMDGVQTIDRKRLAKRVVAEPVRGPEVEISPEPEVEISAEDEDVLKQLRDLVDRKLPIKLTDTDEYDAWSTESEALPKRLNAEAFSVQESIDLHGLTEDEADHAIVEFIKEARMNEFSNVKIIHGRGLRSPGKPVLKSLVRRLLQGPLSKYVQAYTTARANDGGLGATYVLLKRS